MPPLPKIHAAAGAVAMLLIAGLQLTLLRHELAGLPTETAPLRAGILWVVILGLLPAMAVAGGSGAKLARGALSPWVARKMARMKRIAALGLGLLVPLAVLLAWLAAQGRIGAGFVALTQLERLAALTNLVLLGLNMRDGLGRARSRAAASR
ncbi:hypothetical protein CKO11_10055 [Rhodobacter sp. TJ_12]|uniref:hypothetical protein n=1 Tax=Rhodobacter sp. TJ_12 TaxID=2029399 RepID=UPI001CC14F6A|nr:hypothetical protein [Rhodobacter sp. TJ_12]MBZ4022802.1 hypothetical protein [Rhodobacter sp. TJ_12]